jgi:hypothetical protein
MRAERYKMWRRVSRWYQDVVVVRSIRSLGHITRSHTDFRLAAPDDGRLNLLHGAGS